MSGDDELLNNMQTMVSELALRQARAVDQRLAEILRLRGVDPDDRSAGWEDRARDALADLELHDSVEWTDDYRARVVTTLRRRAAT